MTADARPTDRVFFVHLQKTAGTSLIHRLRKRLGHEVLYPDASDGAPSDPASVISVPHLLRRWPDRRSQVRVLTGHFPLCTAELLDEDFAIVTTLREPVERTLSYLRHHRMLTPADADKPLEQLYEDPVRFRSMIHNHMVKMLSLTSERMTDGALTPIECTRVDLERAKANLARIDVVGLQERFDDFWQEVCGRFGWDLGRPARTNRTEPEEASASFRRRIAQDNALDLELHTFARDLVEQRAKT